MDRKNLQDKLDLLSKQMKQIQNEMDSLQEQEDGSNNLVRKICIFDHFDIHY
jgi:prefoldin subunit 5